MSRGVLLALVAAAAPSAAAAQPLNWRSPAAARHLVTVAAGVDYGAVLSVGYGYRLGQTVVGAEWSVPAGRDRVDDFTGRAGVRTVLRGGRAFVASLSAAATVTRFRSPYLAATGLGGDVAAQMGRYGRRWFLAAEVGSDLTVASRLVHSEAYRANYPDVRDGWYRATGGHLRLGVLGGRSIGAADLHLGAGRLFERRLGGAPLVPFYLRVGATVRLGA
ncbi:MAG: hypothetical protein AB7L66_00770 [Gemmatimonadales bacterium]